MGYTGEGPEKGQIFRKEYQMHFSNIISLRIEYRVLAGFFFGDGRSASADSG
jgi:hypothetical protein